MNRASVQDFDPALQRRLVMETADDHVIYMAAVKRFETLKAEVGREARQGLRVGSPSLKF